jgi:hypothetical protein
MSISFDEETNQKFECIHQTLIKVYGVQRQPSLGVIMLAAIRRMAEQVPEDLDGILTELENLSKSSTDCRIARRDLALTLHSDMKQAGYR